MPEKLWDKIQKIHADHPISLSDLFAAQAMRQDWDRFSELENSTRIEVLKAIPHKAGLNPVHLARSIIVQPEMVMVDDRIPGLCGHQYLRPDGTIKACGGVRNRRSACPGSGAPLPGDTQKLLDLSKVVLVVQAENLTNYDQQRQLHVTLLGIEKHIQKSGFEITHSWSAGPCRICPECLGNGDCRTPQLKRYSMEGSGIGVFLTCERIAQVTEDNHWSLSLIDNWELPNQSSPTFKSVVAIGIR